MTKKDRTQYQASVISSYYENRNTIMLQRLSELVTELYLAESASKKERLWQRTHKAMSNLKIPPNIIDHIMATKNVEILAKNLKDWLKNIKKQ